MVVNSKVGNKKRLNSYRFEFISWPLISGWNDSRTPVTYIYVRPLFQGCHTWATPIYSGSWHMISWWNQTLMRWWPKPKQISRASTAGFVGDFSGGSQIMKWGIQLSCETIYEMFFWRSFWPASEMLHFNTSKYLGCYLRDRIRIPKTQGEYTFHTLHRHQSPDDTMPSFIVMWRCKVTRLAQRHHNTICDTILGMKICFFRSCETVVKKVIDIEENRSLEWC